jgi:hypothetical protein
LTNMTIFLKKRTVKKYDNKKSNKEII